MVNRNPRAAPFRERDLSGGGRLPTDLPDVVRSGGEDIAQSARALDVFSDRVGRYADDAMKVEAAQDARLAVAGGTFRPTGGTTLREQAFDATGEPLYLSNVTARFNDEATTLFQAHKDNPAGFQAAFQKLTDTYKRDHVFPGLQSAFETKATTLGTSLRNSAFTNYQAREKDRERATLIDNLRTTETARTKALVADPNAAGIEKLVDGFAAENVLRIRELVAKGHISAVEGQKLEAEARNEAVSSVVTARAGRLGSAEDVETFRASLRTQFTDGKLAIDGGEFEKLDADLAKIAKAKKVAFDQSAGELDKRLNDYLDRHAKGLTPSVAELTAIAAEAEKLGPAGRQRVEEARQKLGIRRLIESVPIERGDAILRELKRGAANVTGQANERERGDLATFRGLGWSPLAASAIVGQLVAESGGRTEARNPGDGRDGSDSIGLSQWNGERAAALKAYAARRGADWTDRATQLAFVDHELRTTERKTGLALANASTPEEAARIMIGYFRPAGWSEGNPEAGHNFSGRLANTRRLSGVGLAASSAGVIEDAEKYLEKRRKLIETDPLAEAERSGTVPEITPLDWQGGAVRDQLGSRVAQAEAVARANGRAPVYLRPDEKARLREVVQQGGESALALVTEIVEGAGPRAGAVLKEIDTDTPRLAALGRMVANGAREQQDAARDGFEALRIEQQPGAKITANPKNAGEIERDVLGAAYGSAIEDRRKAVDAAQLIYRGRMARINADPESDTAEKIYREALRLASGGSGPASARAGGVADYKPPANWFGSMKVLVPENVVTDRFGDVIAALRDEDLAEAPGGRPEQDGKPFSARDFRSAYPVRVPGGYAFAKGVPGSDDPQWITGKDGRPYVMPWDWMQTRLRPRVPQAFR